MFEIISQFWPSFSLSWQVLCMFQQSHIDKYTYFKACWMNLFPIDLGDCDYRAILLSYFTDIRKVPVEKLIHNEVILEDCYILWHDNYRYFAYNLNNAEYINDGFLRGLIIPVSDLSDILLDISNAKICLLFKDGTKILPIKYKHEKWIQNGEISDIIYYTRVMIPSRDEAIHVRNNARKQTKKNILNQIQDQDGVILEEDEVDWDDWSFDVNEIDFEISICGDCLVIEDTIIDKSFWMNQNIDLETDFENGQWLGESHVNLPLENEPKTKWISV